MSLAGGEEAEESVPAVGHAPYFYLITDSREIESLGHVQTEISFSSNFVKSSFWGKKKEKEKKKKFDVRNSEEFVIRRKEGKLE